MSHQTGITGKFPSTIIFGFQFGKEWRFLSYHLRVSILNISDFIFRLDDCYEDKNNFNN